MEMTLAENCQPFNKASDWCESEHAFEWPFDGRLARKNLLLSRSEAEFDYCVSLFSAKTIPDFKQRIDDIVMSLGFSDYALARVASHSIKSGDLMSLSTSATKKLTIGGLCGHEIVFPYDKQCVKVIFKSTINHIKNQKLSHCCESALSLKSYDYYNVPIVACDGNEHIMLCVTQRDIESKALACKVANCLPALQALCEVIDFVATSKFPLLLVWDGERTCTGVYSDPKALWILESLVNKDLTIEQVAQEFCITMASMHKILKRLRRAFGVRTNYAIIKQVVLLGLVEII